MTRLAVPIAAKDFETARLQIKAAGAAGAEILELRTDYLDTLNVYIVEKLLAEIKTLSTGPLPVIVTCRDKRQGGVIDYPEKLRVEILTAALKAGAEFIDFEYENFLNAESQEKIKFALSESSRGRLILSAHNFETKFPDIIKLHRHMKTLHPAAIAKLVYKANHINDCFEAFDLLHTTGDDRIVFCMGAAGLISRIIAKKLGSFITFAAIDEKTATAPGQLTIEQLKSLYRWENINAETELYGVIADPVAHSASPAVHNAAFADIKANKLYLPLLLQGGTEEFNRFLSGITNRRWLSFKGLSITIPHKENALNYVRYIRGNQGFIEPLAEKIGAVNTIVITGDCRLKAYNTDYAGALDAVTSAMKITRADLKDVPIAIIGAGGVSRAIVAGFKDAGAKIKIYNRTVKKARILAADFDCDFASLDDLRTLADFAPKIIINCTSIGMHPKVDHTPLPKELLKKGTAVFDTVYNPAKTLLLKQAREKRIKTIDGIAMFVNQAMAQFKFFTAKDANKKLMTKTITNCLSPK